MGNKTVHEMCLRDLQVNFGRQQSGSPTINMKMKIAQLTISEVQLARTAQPHPVLKDSEDVPIMKSSKVVAVVMSK